MNGWPGTIRGHDSVPAEVLRQHVTAAENAEAPGNT